MRQQALLPTKKALTCANALRQSHFTVSDCRTLLIAIARAHLLSLHDFFSMFFQLIHEVTHFLAIIVFVDKRICVREVARIRLDFLRNRVLLGESIKAARLERNVDIDWLATRSGMKIEAIEAIEAALYPATVDVINRLLRIMSAREPRALGLTPKAIGPRRKKPGF